MTAAQYAFAAFGLASQTLLVAYFASRVRWPRHADRIGWAAYAFGVLGLPLAVGLLIDGQTGFLFVGPLLMAAWALLGTFVDVWRPQPWRGPPPEWKVFVAYLALYFVAQMFLWWPLWNFARGAWAAFLVLFVVNTALNLWQHPRPGSRAA